MMAPAKGYRIGEIAGLTGLTPDTLRFYARRGAAVFASFSETV